MADVASLVVFPPHRVPPCRQHVSARAASHGDRGARGDARGTEAGRAAAASRADEPEDGGQQDGAAGEVRR